MTSERRHSYLTSPPIEYPNESLFLRAIIKSMEVGDIRFYKDRWKAVEEIERQELRAMSLEDHWRKLNAIARFAFETGMKRDDNDGEMEVILLWAKLRAQHETG